MRTYLWEVKKIPAVKHTLTVSHKKGSVELPMILQKDEIMEQEKPGRPAVFVREVEYDNTVRPSEVFAEWEIEQPDGTKVKHALTILCPALNEIGATEP